MALTKAEMAERLFTDVGRFRVKPKRFVDAFFDVVRGARARRTGEALRLRQF
jgi:integration host factor subunit alpha